MPAGLANLGATCYLNVLLQVMFYNRRLRAAVYSFRPPQNVNDRTAKMVEIMQVKSYAWNSPIHARGKLM